MNTDLGWDDYAIVLHIAEAGSLGKAAQNAGTSHPTMFRKINLIEEKLGVRLFERFRNGYQPTVAGEDIVNVARQIRRITNETERRVSARDLEPSGVVKLATTDTLLYGLLMPVIVEFRRLYPAIILELMLSNAISDLSFREADIALRPATTPEPHLVGRKAGSIEQAVYAHKNLVKDGVSPGDLPWICPAASMHDMRLHWWLAKNGFDKTCICRIDSLLGIYKAAGEGLGAALLPVYLAHQNPDLPRVGGVVEDMTVDLWLLTHPDLQKTVRIRAVLDYLFKTIRLPAL